MFFCLNLLLFLSFVHCSQRNLHYLTFPLEKTMCIFMVSLAKAVCSYSVLLGRMKTNAASLDETRIIPNQLNRGKKCLPINTKIPNYDKTGVQIVFLGVISQRF